MAHNLQGLSLNEEVISFDLKRQKSFILGQMYVTSSVTTFMDKMHLIGELSKSASTVNLPAKEEYQRLRKESLLESLQVMSAAEFTLTISV